jgi:HSP20 family protein
MSDKDINPFDWYRNFLEQSLNNRRNFMNFFNTDVFKEFNFMQEEMERIFNQFNEVKSNPPKELVREYQTQNGDKVREIGPIVFGYSMTIGPDGRPTIREFGNVKRNKFSQGNGNINTIDREAMPRIRGEREPLADINMTEKEIKVILEMPGVKKEDIKLSMSDNMLEIYTNDLQRKYRKTIEIPPEADTDTTRSTFTNGILEITFNKKDIQKAKGREIKIE